MTDSIPNISDAEWQVMQVLWKESPLTAAEIIDKINPETNWSRKTVHTLIRRLVKKKVVGLQKSNPYQYYPLFEEEYCKKKETKTFLDKVYNGSLQLLMANFLKNEKLSKKEVDQIKNLLDKNKDGDHKK